MVDKLRNSLEKILFNPYVIFLILFILFKPLLFFYYPAINRIFNFAMIAAGTCILLYYILNIIKTRKISQLQIAILIFIAILSISTLLMSKDFSTVFKIYGRWFILSIYTESLLLKQRERFLKILNFLCLFLITAQFLSIIYFPEGIVNASPEFKVYIYFLGNDNTTTITMILGALYNLFYAQYKNDRRLTIAASASIIMVSLSFLLTWCATGLIGVALLLIFVCYFRKQNKLPKIFNLRSYLILAIVLFLAIVVFRLQSIFGFFIEGVLHKDLTFSYRTLIWDSCLYYVKEYPLLGIGVQDFSARLAAMNIYHAHCTFLHTLLEGGVIGFFAFLNIFRVIWNKMKTHLSCNAVTYISFGILIYFITGIVEVFQDSQMLYIFLVLGYYSPLICKEHTKCKKS